MKADVCDFYNFSQNVMWYHIICEGDVSDISAVYISNFISFRPSIPKISSIVMDWGDDATLYIQKGNSRPTMLIKAAYWDLNKLDDRPEVDFQRLRHKRSEPNYQKPLCQVIGAFGTPHIWAK